MLLFEYFKKENDAVFIVVSVSENIFLQKLF